MTQPLVHVDGHPADQGRSRATTSQAPAAATARRLVPRSGASAGADRLARLAAHLLGTAAAQVSLLTDVQTVVGGAGLDPGAIGGSSPLEDSLCTMTANAGSPFGVTNGPADDRVACLPPISSGAVAAYLGVPLVATSGDVIGALCVHDPRPRTWAGSDVDVLQQLAPSVVAELELAALTEEYGLSASRWELAVDAADIGTFEWDLASGELTWDERMLRFFGFDEGTFDRTVESFSRRVHPDDRARVTALIEEAVDAHADFEVEYRVVPPHGHTRWIQARGRVLCEDDGRADRVVGAAYETTALREGEARLSRVLETMSAGFLSLDQDWRVTFVNAEGERVLGFSREAMLGRDFWELFPAAIGTLFEERYRHAVASGEQVIFDAYYPAPLDAWYEARAWSSPDGLSISFVDVTARRREQERAESALARGTLLALVTTELGGTLDAEVGVARLARLVVPTVADWCIVSLVRDGPGPEWTRLRDVGCAHVDPGFEPLVQRYAEYRLAAVHGGSFLAGVLMAGEELVIREDAKNRIGAALPPGDARDVLQRLAPEAAAVLPLRAHGRTLGVITLFWGVASVGSPADRLLDDRLQVALEVAARAGLALDNARLYAQQRRLAEGLQRSLLTEPPKPDHMQVAVRYMPAAEAAQVGGDWYDAFLQRDGQTVLVIGDVVGHDTEAAAAMGQVRGLLRGIAATTGDGPAGVLSRLDEAMELLDVGTTATAVVARLEQTPDERDRGVTRLRLSNAGHPPPMALHADGSVIVLAGMAGVDADLLLGIDATLPRTESEVVLDRGATVLLYTDGLVERRGQSLDEGLARLRSILSELADRSLEELCDEVLERMLPPDAEDDVALAAVRLHRQDRPRPDDGRHPTLEQEQAVGPS